MKIIRLIAALLMLVSGLWHGYLGLSAAENKPMLAFAIAYLIVGILLLIGNSWGFYLGIIFPLTGIIAASVKIGWSHFDLTMTTLIVIDFIVILSCILILLNQRRTSIQV